MLHNSPRFPPGGTARSGRRGARVAYEERADQAEAWSAEHDLRPADEDEFRVCLVLVDVQNTFCVPDFELFVAGGPGRARWTTTAGCASSCTATSTRSRRSCRPWTPTRPSRSFTPSISIDENGRHPSVHARFAEDVERGRWRVNPKRGPRASGSTPSTRSGTWSTTRGSLERGGKYSLTVWPYHALLGGIGHALVSAVEEAVFFHAIARASQPQFQVKGSNPLTEHYSVLGPEVTDGPDGEPIAAAERGADRRGCSTSTRSSSPARRRATASRGRSRTCWKRTCAGAAAGRAFYLSRTAPRPWSSRASSTTPTRRMPRWSAGPRAACTSCARRSRSSAGRGSTGARAAARRRAASSSRRHSSSAARPPRAARRRLCGRDAVLELVAGPRQRLPSGSSGFRTIQTKSSVRGAPPPRPPRRATARERARSDPARQHPANGRGDQQRAEQVRAASLVLLAPLLAVLVRPDRRAPPRGRRRGRSRGARPPPAESERELSELPRQRPQP